MSWPVSLSLYTWIVHYSSSCWLIGFSSGFDFQSRPPRYPPSRFLENSAAMKSDFLASRVLCLLRRSLRSPSSRGDRARSLRRDSSPSAHLLAISIISPMVLSFARPNSSLSSFLRTPSLNDRIADSSDTSTAEFFNVVQRWM